LWTEEVSRGLLIWLVMLGAGYGFLRQEHFLMSAFVDGLSPATKRKVQIVVQLIVLV
jgi:TRAP-type C4-dicarboxylate transport system permease small subunit